MHNFNLYITLIITIIILFFLAIIILLNINKERFDNIETFLSCVNNNISIPKFENMNANAKLTNNDRLTKNKRGPINNFHQKFNQNDTIKEHEWRKNLENNINNINNTLNIDPEITGTVNPIDNIYNYVNY